MFGGIKIILIWGLISRNSQKHDSVFIKFCRVCRKTRINDKFWGISKYGSFKTTGSKKWLRYKRIK